LREGAKCLQMSQVLCAAQQDHSSTVSGAASPGGGGSLSEALPGTLKPARIDQR
jgi:hypothetical protein